LGLQSFVLSLLTIVLVFFKKKVKEEKMVSVIKEEDWFGNLRRGQIIDYREVME